MEVLRAQGVANDFMVGNRNPGMPMNLQALRKRKSIYGHMEVRENGYVSFYELIVQL